MTTCSSSRRSKSVGRLGQPAELLLHQPNTEVAERMAALRKFLGENDMMAYLTMMANRVLELHRVLKPTGSRYLHFEPTKPILKEAAAAGFYNSANGKNYPRIQVLTIEALVAGKKLEHPDYRPDLNFKKAKAEKTGQQLHLKNAKKEKSGEQLGLDMG